MSDALKQSEPAKRRPLPGDEVVPAPDPCRDGARRLGDALLLADMLTGAEPVRLEVDQLPVAPGDRWVALPYGDDDVPAGRVSIVGYVPDGPLGPDEDGPGDRGAEAG